MVHGRVGQKIQDEGLLNHIHKALVTDRCFFNFSKEAVEVLPNQGFTVILLSGIDRPEFVYELIEVLTYHKCKIVNAEILTLKHHATAVIHVIDELTGYEIYENRKVSSIKKDLQSLIKRQPQLKSSSPRLVTGNGRTDVKTEDKEDEETLNANGKISNGHVSVSNFIDKGYTLVVIDSIDRPKLLLDTISALTVMQYVVFHGMLTTGEREAYQEYYIRHIHGQPISTMAERMLLQEALEEAIANPNSEGVELELCTDGHLEHLSDISTRLKEKGCWIKRGKISTIDGVVKHTYFLTDMSGGSIDQRTIDMIHEQIGENVIRVKKKVGCSPKLLQQRARGFLLSGLLKRLTSQISKFFQI